MEPPLPGYADGASIPRWPLDTPTANPASLAGSIEAAVLALRSKLEAYPRAVEALNAGLAGKGGDEVARTALPALSASLGALNNLRESARAAAADLEAVLSPSSPADLLDRGEAKRVLPEVLSLVGRVGEVEEPLNGLRTKLEERSRLLAGKAEAGGSVGLSGLGSKGPIILGLGPGGFAEDLGVLGESSGSDGDEEEEDDDDDEGSADKMDPPLL